MMKNQTIMVYIVGISIVAMVYFPVYLVLVSHAVAIGDSANPVLSLGHSIALTILNFPMMYFYIPIGDWLEPFFTDDGVFYLFSVINALIWGIGLVFLGRLIKKWINRKGMIK